MGQSSCFSGSSTLIIRCCFSGVSAGGALQNGCMRPILYRGAVPVTPAQDRPRYQVYLHLRGTRTFYKRQQQLPNHHSPEAAQEAQRYLHHGRVQRPRHLP